MSLLFLTRAVRHWETVVMLFLTLFQHLRRHSRHHRQGRCHGRLAWRWVPQVEALEDRTALSTLLVTRAADDGSAGTLRAVLATAHNGDTIQFAPALEGQTISLVQGQLVVNQSLDINGPGADQLAISGNAASRVFDVSSGAAVTIAGLTLTQGRASDGAGVLNAGTLTLTNDHLKGNVAQGIAGGGLFGDGSGRGGGIENQANATLVVSKCTLAGNQALGAPGGGNAFGGAIDNQAGLVTIDNPLSPTTRLALVTVAPSGWRPLCRAASAPRCWAWARAAVFGTMAVWSPSPAVC
jgi:hypothetical protein